MNFKYSYRVYIHELERIRNACDGLQYSCGTKNVLCVVAGEYELFETHSADVFNW